LTLAVALMAGFIALSYEILWYRAFSFVSWSHPTVFGLLLGFYLAGVAIGSSRSRNYCRTPEPTAPDATRDDGKPLRVLAAFVLCACLAGFLVLPILGFLAKSNWLSALFAVAVSAGLLGAVLPLVAHFGISADDRAGQRLSYVYLANIVGSAAGSFLTGFVLMDVWSTQVITVALSLLGLVMVLLLFLASRPAKGTLSAGLGVVALSGVLIVLTTPLLFDHFYEKLLYKKTYHPGQTFAHLVENRHGVIAVNEHQQVFGGGAYDGAFNVSLVDDKNLIERAFAVSALHPHPRQVLMVGLSSGSWAQVVANLPEVEHLTIIEINPGYLELIQKYEAVKSLLTNPKVDIVIDDGRRWLLRHPERKFDFSVMNTTFHFRAHASGLLSREFMELVRAHLLPGGVHYFNTTSSEDVQRTAAIVFPYAMRVINFMAASDAPLTFDRPRWERTLREASIDGVPVLDLSVPGERTLFERLLKLGGSSDREDHAAPYSLEGRETLLARTTNAKLVTDDNMICEWENVLTFPDGSDF